MESDVLENNDNDSAASGRSVHVATSSLFCFPVNYSLRAAVLAGYTVVSIKGCTLAAIGSSLIVCLLL